MWSLVKAFASEQVAYVRLREIFVLPATDPIFDLKVGSQFWSLDLEKEAFKYVRIFLKEFTLIRINPKTQIINEIEHLRSHRGPPERNGVIHISYFPESIEVSHNIDRHSCEEEMLSLQKKQNHTDKVISNTLTKYEMKTMKCQMTIHTLSKEPFLPILLSAQGAP